MSHIKKQLISGAKKHGDQIESVRELALLYGVNPNTMQKALAELEREGYLHSDRSSGRSVTCDVSAIENLKNFETNKTIGTFIKEMAELGIGKDALLKKLEQYISN